MTTSPETLREAVERLTVTAQNDKLIMSPDLRLVLSALQEAREALGPFAEAVRDADVERVPNDAAAWESPMAMSVTYGDFRRAAEVYRALSPGGADA